MTHATQISLFLRRFRASGTDRGRFLVYAWMIAVNLHPALAVSDEAVSQPDSTTPAASPTQTILPPVIVQDYSKTGLFDNRVDDANSAQINTAKKSLTSYLKDKPAQTDQNFRQMLSEIPGLLVSEVPNQSFTSLNVRGVGDPHESFNVQILEDGLPISADPYGYPASYYSPPSPAIEQIDFYKGGSNLLFGPQPGGAINYLTKSLLPSSPLSITSQQVGGTNRFWSSYNELSTPVINDKMAIRLTYNKRQGDGFRDNNQDFDSNYFQLKTTADLGSTILTTKADYTDGEFGEPGGLSTSSTSNTIGIDQGIRRNTLNNDRLFIERVSFMAQTDTRLGFDTLWINKIQTSHLDRTSRRQSLGGVPTFGGIAAGTTTAIQKQTFLNTVLDSRLRTKVNPSFTYSAGFFGFYSTGSFTQKTGTNLSTLDGTTSRDLDRSSLTGSLFLESEITVSRFKLVPGFRIERIRQSIQETTNSADPSNLRNTTRTDLVPLAGLGALYTINSKSESYFNASQGYRPVVFQEAVPLLQGASISSDLDPSKSWSSEIGVRSNRQDRFVWDVSAFFIRYENQTGRVGTQFTNVGNASYGGLELAGTYRLVKTARFGEWIFHSNVTALKAKFTRGLSDNKTPQYAPAWLNRVKLEHRLSDKVRYSLLGTTVSGHFADDGNTTNQRIPGYTVWDLMGEWTLTQRVTLLANIQNLLNRNYWSRVRSNGIDPAQPFNLQTGVRIAI